MRLVIEDIYSEQGKKALAEAYTKSFWQSSIYHRTSWLGAPQLQIPEDTIALAELIWKVRPALIVECGIWEGGGLIFYSSMLQLLGGGSVIGVDVDVSRAQPIVKGHPFGHRVQLIQASSVAPETVGAIQAKVAAVAGQVLFILDSNHTAAHVRGELEAYAPMVRPGGYIVAMDGIMNILHDVPGGHPSWITDNPETAVQGFLAAHQNFQRDPSFNRFGVSYAPGGFLRRIN